MQKSAILNNLAPKEAKNIKFLIYTFQYSHTTKPRFCFKKEQKGDYTETIQTSSEI
jgi:HKD family nuclease